MKKVNRLFILFFGYLITAIAIDACRQCPHLNYDINGISLKNIIYKPDNCKVCYDTYLTDTTILQYSSYGIRIEFNNIVYSYLNNFNLISTASAVDCWISYSLKHKIENISIYTLNDFDESHKVNSDISSYFKAIDDNAHSAPQLGSIDSTLNDEYFINSKNYYGNIEQLDLLLRR